MALLTSIMWCTIIGNFLRYIVKNCQISVFWVVISECYRPLFSISYDHKCSFWSMDHRPVTACWQQCETTLTRQLDNPEGNEDPSILLLPLVIWEGMMRHDTFLRFPSMQRWTDFFNQKTFMSYKRSDPIVKFSTSDTWTLTRRF